MAKIHLNASTALLAACEPGKRKTDHWCTTIPGFVLEARSSGNKTYYLRYFDSAGRQRQHKIGGFADITFDKARKAAIRLRSAVVLGGQPAGDKDVKRAIPSYGSLAADHLAHAATYQRSYSSTELIMNKHILPRWGKLRLDEIVPQDIGRWLAEKAGEGLKPATVEKIRVVFNRTWELGRQWDVTGAESNPVQRVPRRSFSNARERFLTAQEAARLKVAVEASSNPQLKHIVALLLLTGARLGELLSAEWKDLHLERRVWLIPTSKTGKPRHVPLSQAAIDVIGQLRQFEGCPYLLPNPETKSPYVTVKHAWQTARKAAGLRDLRLHDLRHSAASFMINAGIDLYAVGKVLGHADHKSTMRYSHLANETLLAAVEAGAANMRL